VPFGGFYVRLGYKPPALKGAKKPHGEAWGELLNRKIKNKIIAGPKKL